MRRHDQLGVTSASRRPPVGDRDDRGVTLVELLAVVATSSVVLLAAAALVLPLLIGAQTVQGRALASSDVAASARVHRDLDRQLRSATRVQYVDAQRLRLCTYASTEASTRTWLQWTSPPAVDVLESAPVGEDPAGARTYALATATFEAPPTSPADGTFAPGQLVSATLRTWSGQPAGGATPETWSGEPSVVQVLSTLPRPTTQESCP